MQDKAQTWIQCWMQNLKIPTKSEHPLVVTRSILKNQDLYWTNLKTNTLLTLYNSFNTSVIRIFYCPLLKRLTYALRHVTKVSLCLEEKNKEQHNIKITFQKWKRRKTNELLSKLQNVVFQHGKLVNTEERFLIDVWNVPLWHLQMYNPFVTKLH